MNEETYYSILGVSESATQDEIKKAYRKLAKENHPDAGGDEETFKKISVAYDAIGDEEKRKRYDYERTNPFAKMSGGGFGPSFDELFQSMFGGRQRAQQTRVHSTNIDYTIGTVDSYIGGRRQVTYKRKSMCDPCQGTGGDKRVCHICQGQGQIMTQMGSGMFIQMVAMNCNGCSGHGYILTNPCFVCNGHGNKDEMKTVEINFPHGVDDGQFLRLQSLGDFRNGVYGDLILRIKIEEQNNFQKVGNALLYNAFFDLDDIQKDSFEIPHPDGALSVKFPKKMDTSKPLRVKGKGFKLETVGDLVINQFLKFHRD